MPGRRALVLVTFGVVAAASLSAAQAPRHVRPPLPSVYEILDLGPAPAATCTCVPHPFALPAHHPGWAYGSGPSVPFTDPPISDADRRYNVEWDANEEREMRGLAARALEGNALESLSVALHLAVHPSIFGADDRVEQDVVRWLALAAEQGNVDASWLLAHRYAVGRGAAQDYAMAAYWFDRAARHDNPIAMTAIGFLRAAGRGVAQSWPEAIRWWRRAETRTPVAARFLGDAYACGVGVDEDHERAAAAYRQAAALELSASVQLGHMYLQACTAGDDKAALGAFQRAADQGDPEAQIEVSELLRQGRGAEVDPYHAYMWARMADRRLPSGALKTRAQASAAAAARLMSAFEIADADRLLDDVLARGAQPMR